MFQREALGEVVELGGGGASHPLVALAGPHRGLVREGHARLSSHNQSDAVHLDVVFLVLFSRYYWFIVLAIHLDFLLLGGDFNDPAHLISSQEWLPFLGSRILKHYLKHLLNQ